MHFFRPYITLFVLVVILGSMPLMGQVSGVQDTLKIPELEGYVADTAGTDWFDTSYFFPGDPEANLRTAAEYGKK